MARTHFTATSLADIARFFRSKARYCHEIGQEKGLTTNAKREWRAQELTFIECALILEATTIKRRGDSSATPDVYSPEEADEMADKLEGIE
jgi:hypothetical protein